MGSGSDAYGESLTAHGGCFGNLPFLQRPPKPLKRSNKGISHHAAGQSLAGYIPVYPDRELQQHMAPGLRNHCENYHRLTTYAGFENTAGNCEFL